MPQTSQINRSVIRKGKAAGTGMRERESEGDYSSLIRSPANGVEEVERERRSRVEEACRRFENYLAEMIAEEGKVRELMDVEELLYCWSHLNSPVFMELVGRFYGELCSDLFAGAPSGGSDNDDDDDDKTSDIEGSV